MDDKRKPRILISGGGTGGHIFPAVAIANALRRRCGAEILFVGAEDRMEMEKVPAAGYPIKGLPVAGFDRKNLLRNFAVVLKLRKSMAMARRIVRDFRPDIAIGVGGYASGPTLKAAQKAGIPTLLQEQNSYAGVTNKLLAKKAGRICVAYGGMERFFPADRIVKTGNPVRAALLEPRPPGGSPPELRAEARQAYPAGGGRKPRGAHPERVNGKRPRKARGRRDTGHLADRQAFRRPRRESRPRPGRRNRH